MPPHDDTTRDDTIEHTLAPGELPDPQTSLTLLAMAQGGDREALEELVGRYHERLRRIVRIQLRGSTVGTHLDSVDIVQETFRGALPKLKDLRPSSAAGLLQWLAVIATNRIRDAHEYLHRAKRDVGRLDGPLNDVPARHPAANEPGPAEAAALTELRELLDIEVAALPPDQRRVVLLRDYCGEDWAEIAADLGRKPGAAKMLHQRAWIRLRAALGSKLESD